MGLEGENKNCQQIRELIFQMSARARSCHVGSALSCVEILWAIYLEQKPGDHLVFSKGHGAMAFYGMLATAGYYPPEQVVAEFLVDGKKFLGHISHHLPPVELSTGSLGHGMNYALGLAYKFKYQQCPGKVVVVISDGECNEGSVWEAALFAGHHQLDNLLVLIDHNQLQGLGHCQTIVSLHDFAAKWQAFGFSATECDGHDLEVMRRFLRQEISIGEGRPQVAICHTVKGKGWPGYEGTVQSHYHPYPLNN